MVYPRLAWLKPKPPMGSPDYDSEKGHLSHDERLDVYYDYIDDRLNDEKCDRAEREENIK